MPDRVQKQISWFLVAKSLIKFVDDEKSYKLSEKVMAANDFKQYPLLKNDTADVSIEDGVVTYLRKVKKDAPKVENKGSEEKYEPTADEQKPKTVAPNPVASVPSTNSQVVGEVKELTIFAVAQNKRVVKFLEIKDDGWFQIDPSIQAKDYQEIGLIARNKCKVQLIEKNVISFEKVVGEAPAKATKQPKTATSSQADVKSEPTPTSANTASVATPTVKKEWKPYNSQETDSRQRSIEAQAAVNSANDTVGRIAAQIDPKPTASVINAMIRAIAESNFALIQELKTK